MNSIAYAPFRPVFDSKPAPDLFALSVRLRRFLRGDHVLVQLLRFALVGAASNIAYLLLFVLCSGIGTLTANVVGSIVSTLIANELHRRLTFRAAGQVGWFAAQCQGSGLALVGLAVSTTTLAVLESCAPDLAALPQAAAMLAVMAAVGGARFLALRYLVF
ncbi:GtrA family protein [Nocardia sp. NPDC127579]|uniref:GtrA family protein n=1 Tax=Nocardia sp. NPDC127579 TaxID=3345402 RepID=UPI00363F7F4A